MDLKSKQTKSYIWYLTETHFSFEDTHMGSEWRDEKDTSCKWKPKEYVVPILMSDKTDVKPKMVIRDRKGHYIMIKSSIHWEDITVINICIHNFGAPKCIKSSKVWKEKQTTIK